MPDNITNWLLEGPAYIEYNTRIHLLGQSDDDPAVKNARNQIPDDENIKILIESVSTLPWIPLTSHKKADHPLHQLGLLLDIGLANNNAKWSKALIKNLLSSQSDEDAFQIPMKIPVHFGGSGEIELSWALCDAPLVLHHLVKLGVDKNNPQIKKAVEHIVSLVDDNGWHCRVSTNLGKFRGPGRKADPCPYATLVSLKALALFPEYHDCEATRIGTETLLQLWANSREQGPYMFKMGTDFRKPKAPLLWYDILHVVDVLSQFEWCHSDKRFIEMVDIIKSKADNNGKYTAESVYRAYKNWDFGQKKVPSMWITLQVYRILGKIK